MKKNIINILLSGAVVLGMASCSENEWNEKFLEGFESDSYYDPTASGTTYTLTDADYASISGTMKKLAQTSEEEALADNIKNTLSFDKNSIYNAKFAIPYFLNTSTNPEYNAPVGSTVDIVYAETGDTPEESLNLMQAARYTVSTANYQDAWGSETDYIKAYTPAKPAQSYLPGVLKEAIANPTEGQYAVVSYGYTTTEPVFGTTDDPGEITLSSVLTNLAVNATVEATAVVTAVDTRGVVITDNAGSLLYYQASGFETTEYPVGTVVKAKGTVSSYNNALQLDKDKGATIEAIGSQEYEYPAPKVYTGAEADAVIQLTDNFQATYVALKGQYSQSGNYNNIIIDGAETAQGSIYYVTDDIKAQLINGESYTFYGYYVAISKSGGAPKFFNIVLTEVGSIDDDPSATYKVSSAIHDLAVGDDLTATAIVTAIDSRGMVLTDNAGSILYYQASGFDQNAYTIGDVLNVAGPVTAYNKGLQLANGTTTLELVGHREYTYPEPTLYTGPMIDDAIKATDNMLATYVAIQGTMSISGNYLNVIVDGAETAQGSVYYVSDAIKPQLVNGETYTLYGYYVAISSSKYFNIVVTNVEAPTAATTSMFATRAALNSPAVQEQKAVYYYDGSAWAPATNVFVLSTADYEGMGIQSGQFTDNNQAALYISTWLRQQCTYAQEGDEVYVLYNSTSAQVGFFVYNNGTWTLNNNGYEVVTGRFIRKAYKWEATDWEFQKSVGKQTYVLFDQDEIQLDATYLLAFDNVCATPVPTTANYGYLLPYEFAEDEGAVTLSSDYYGFTFATTCVYDDVEYTAPEGMFMLVDANGSYYYLQGTYQSFNIRKTGAPYIDGGAISPQYLYKAVNNGDGTWSITNDNADSGTRTIYYSTGYSNFAAYFSQKDADHLIKLYKLSDGTEEDAEGEGE